MSARLERAGSLIKYRVLPFPDWYRTSISSSLGTRRGAKVTGDRYTHIYFLSSTKVNVLPRFVKRHLIQADPQTWLRAVEPHTTYVYTTSLQNYTQYGVMLKIPQKSNKVLFRAYPRFRSQDQSV